MLRLAAVLLLLSAPAFGQSRPYCDGRVVADGFSVAPGSDREPAATYMATLRNTSEQPIQAVVNFRAPQDFSESARDLSVTLQPDQPQQIRLGTARGGDAQRITAALPNMTEVACR
jgi:hypothetical protein